MSIWVNVSEVNNILGKALGSCKDELSPSFYCGARLMLDKINEMAEEVADTPQTERMCDADCNEDCIECAEESKAWQTDCGWKWFGKGEQLNLFQNGNSWK